MADVDARGQDDAAGAQLPLQRVDDGARALVPRIPNARREYTAIAVRLAASTPLPDTSPQATPISSRSVTNQSMKSPPTSTPAVADR